MEFLRTLKTRDKGLYYFGGANLILAIILVGMSVLLPHDFLGTNAWYKPIKFALSIGTLSWTIAWLTGYLEDSFKVRLYVNVFIACMAFEIIYITIQAGRGQLSHFNESNTFYRAMYTLMALASAIPTLWTGYIGMDFFRKKFDELPDYYLRGIQWGIVLFVIFALEGFAMGAALRHTVGAADGGKGLTFLNWSVSHGDLRIAHFIGMHALQVLPLLSFYVLKNKTLTNIAGIFYTSLAVFVLVQALMGIPLIQETILPLMSTTNQLIF